MIRKIALIAALLASLSACSLAQQEKFVAGDAKTAFDIANSSNQGAKIATDAVDPDGAKCWGALGPSVDALMSGKQIGMMALMEIYRVAAINVKGPCSALAVPILLQIGKIPGANAILSQFPII